MKNIFASHWFTRIAAAALTVVIGLSAFSPAPVFAQSPTPEPSSPQQPADRTANRKQRLENAFSRENDWLKIQANHLDRLSDLAAKGQSLIDKAKEKGWDVSELQTALTIFNRQIANAQALHRTAAGILTAHKGFNDNGKVTDVDAAAQTVKDARQSLNDAHNVIRQAVVDLRGAIRRFREEHPGQKKAAPSTAPTAVPAGNS